MRLRNRLWGSEMVAAYCNEPLAHWYDTYQTAIRSPLRILRCAALRADALQDALLAVLQAPPPEAVASDGERLRAWLFVVVQRRAVSLLRRERRRAHAPLTGEEASNVRHTPNETAVRVRAALDQLATEGNGAAARLLEMRFLEERSVAELADELNRTR